MRTHFLLGREHDLIVNEIGPPVDWTLLQPLHADAGGGDVLPVERVLCVLAPRHLGRVDDQATSEGGLARRGEERVDFGLLDVVVGGVKFTLDRAEPTIVAELCDQIDAGVGLLPPVGLGPLAEGPSIFILLGHLGIMLEELDAQPFEVGAFLALGLGPGAVALKQITNRIGHSNFPRELNVIGIAARRASVSASLRCGGWVAASLDGLYAGMTVRREFW